MNQIIPFNTANGGTTPNMCLANVCAGYGIPNKYASAWEAWQHTQQHTDPIPDGLDVPLYYSYTADLGDGPQNYGHINVRLKDGTVWSDGTIYANLDAYLANHTPKYVGWGESINDTKIIEGEDMKVDDALARRLYSLSTLMAVDGDAPDRQPTMEEIQTAIGRDAVEFCDYLMSTLPWGANWNKVKHYDEDVKQPSPTLPQQSPEKVPTPVVNASPPEGQGVQTTPSGQGSNWLGRIFASILVAIHRIRSGKNGKK